MIRARVVLAALGLFAVGAGAAFLRLPRLRGDEDRPPPGFERVRRAIARRPPRPSVPGLRERSPERRNKLVLSDAAWRARLAPQAYGVLRRGGTEEPFSSPLLKVRGTGTFVCAGCGAPLFGTAAKFDSGTGWPSFVRPAGAGAVWRRLDPEGGGRLVEALCARCDGHLGHVFMDGPKDRGGLRYCIDGAALRFVAKR